MPIEFLVSNDPGPTYAYNGTAFVEIAAAQGWPVINGGRIGLFQSGSTLVLFTYDTTLHKIHAYTSTDGGNTWAEADAAHAPTYNQSGTTSPSNTDIDFAVCQSSKNPAVFYAVYFSGAALASQFVTLSPFTVGTGWGTAIVSTLNLVNIGGGIQLDPANNCATVYRSTDDSVFFLTMIGTAQGGNSPAITYYAQCFPNGSGWSVSWTQVGPNNAAGAPGGTAGCTSMAATVDSSGNVCVWMNAQIGTGGSTAFHIYFRRIHGDNTLGAIQIVDSTNYTNQPYFGSAFTSAGGQLYVALTGVGISPTIYSGATSDAPAWTKSTVATLHGGVPSWIDFLVNSGTVTALTAESDGLSISSAPSPFSSVSLVATSPASIFSVFALSSAAASSGPILTLTFKGMKVYR